MTPDPRYNTVFQSITTSPGDNHVSQSVTVRYFGSISEDTDTDEESVELEETVRLDRLIDRLVERHPNLEAHLEQAAVAVNEETVDPSESTVSPGDEVALLPPFGGGASEKDPVIRITENGDDMALGEHVPIVSRPGAGGIATFTGTVRDSNEDRNVDFLEYESHPSMAKDNIQSIIREARDRWNERGSLRFAVSHRVGRVEVGEPAVTIAVSAPHRAEALEACRYLIDELKKRVPIWKKEHFEDGEVWVDNPGAVQTEEADDE
jgi:molybdopterin converting factor subunit 1